MKVFISWSGELSKQIAQILSKKIPCVIQYVTPFVSSIDIDKGEQWSSRITAELSTSKFGIVCLTAENVSAPWVHFEAGAISNSLDTRVSALLVGIQPSDMQGPLKQFQATQILKTDFLSLLQSINKASDTPAKEDILTNTFDMAWPTIEFEMNQAISQYPTVIKKVLPKAESSTNIAIEEILSLVRKQNNILSIPEQFLPEKYISNAIFEAMSSIGMIRQTNNTNSLYNVLITEISNWMTELYLAIQELPPTISHKIINDTDLRRIFALIESAIDSTDIILPSQLRARIKSIGSKLNKSLSEPTRDNMAKRLGKYLENDDNVASK